MRTKVTYDKKSNERRISMLIAIEAIKFKYYLGVTSDEEI
jgi:hypothetical protein